MTDGSVEWPNIYTTPTGERHDDNEGLKEATFEHYEFWHSRPELLSIYMNSRRTMFAPWTVLGLAICRSLVSIPWTVQYRSYMGTAALNIGVVNVGDSGGGKSRLAGLLDECLPFYGRVPKFNAVEVGSGEAIADVYAHRAEKDDPALGIRRGDLIWHNQSRARLFSFDEVGRMFKLGNRDSGSTIFEYVKQGISGSTMGRYLAKGAGTLIEPGEYRFVFTTNAQPSRSGVLLSPDEVEGGFPGRLLWFETRDPRAVPEQDDSEVVPYGIKEMNWENHPFVHALPQMDAAHKTSRALYHTDQRDPIDGHLDLTRAKVAVALMRLNGRWELNDEDWDLAGVVIEENVRVRRWVQQVLAMKGKEQDRARGEALARQNAAAETATETIRLNRIIGLLRKYDSEGVPQKDWRTRLASRDREFYPDALREMGL